MHLELNDLPPKMRQQVLAQIAHEEKRKQKKLSRSARAEKLAKSCFESRGEYEFYTGTVLPAMRRGEVLMCEQHPEFPLFGPGVFCGIKLGAIRYTADFRLTYADGTVEVVEIKSRFVRKMQRDYPLRRRLFIENYAKPNGWRFREVLTDEKQKDFDAWQGRRKKK